MKKAPSTVSRGSSLEREPDGLVTLSGGKITDYRKMAEGAMKLIRQLLQEEYGVTVKRLIPRLIRSQAAILIRRNKKKWSKNIQKSVWKRVLMKRCCIYRRFLWNKCETHL